MTTRRIILNLMNEQDAYNPWVKHGLDRTIVRTHKTGGGRRRNIDCQGPPRTIVRVSVI